MNYHFCSPKAGIGTSTTAAIFALALQRPVLLIGSTDSDLPAILGMPEQPNDSVVDINSNGAQLVITDRMWDDDYPALVDHNTVVCDWGNRLTALNACLNRVHRNDMQDTVMQVLNQCYLTLRRAVATPVMHKPMHNIVLTEPTRAIRTVDVESAVGPVSIELPYDDNISRTVDAGLLSRRLPRPAGAFGEWALTLKEEVTQ